VKREKRDVRREKEYPIPSILKGKTLIASDT